jgi:hypothetical protein
LDWSRYVQEVLIATSGGPCKNPPFLMILRHSLDAAQLAFFKALAGGTIDYMGVPVLVQTGKGNGAIALLNSSIAVFGQLADVKAAIRRHGTASRPAVALANKAGQYRGRYDAWLVSVGPLSAPANESSAGIKTDFMERLDAMRGGIRFSPDFDLSAEMVARTEKDAAGMMDAVRWLHGAVEVQAKKMGQIGATGLENIKFERDGKRILISLRVPEEQVRLALQRRSAANSAQAVLPENATPRAPNPAQRDRRHPARSAFSRRLRTWAPFYFQPKSRRPPARNSIAEATGRSCIR